MRSRWCSLVRALSNFCYRCSAVCWMLFGSIGNLTLTASDGGERSTIGPRFVAVGYDLRCVTSVDGKQWENVQEFPGHSGEKEFLLRGVAYGDETIVAVGGSSTSRILVSRDARNWKDVSFKQNFVGDVTYGKGRFVAVGYQRAMHSKNGYDWSQPVRNNASSWRKVTFGNERFVAVGRTGKEGDAGFVTVSDEGEVWETKQLADGRQPNSIAFGNGRFVMVGSQGFRESSVDGKTWDSRVKGDANELLSDVIWTGHEFIAYGSRGGYSSKDGIQWQAWATRAPSRMCYGAGVFVGCSAGKFSFSTDGRTWTPTAASGTASITSIIFIPGTPK